MIIIFWEMIIIIVTAVETSNLTRKGISLQRTSRCKYIGMNLKEVGYEIVN
jgi:hypothetical protein